MRLAAATVFFSLAFLPFSAGMLRGQNFSGAGDAAISVSQSNIASVTAVSAGKFVDAVLIDAGYDRNFCTGARCSVERAGVPVAEIIIAEALWDRAAALITNLENNQTIQTGDTVKLKTI